jgi:hypothetical protein
MVRDPVIWIAACLFVSHLLLFFCGDSVFVVLAQVVIVLCYPALMLVSYLMAERRLNNRIRKDG